MKARLIPALIVVAVALTLLNPAATLAKEEPPVGGEPKPFKVPEVVDTKLSNGIPVTFVPFGRVPKTTIRVVVRVGNLNEGARTWLADLTIDLMREGAAGKTGPQLSRAASSMGGSLGTNTGLDESSFSINVLEEFGAQAVGLLADVILRPDFPESEFDRIRADYLRNLAVRLARPQPQARRVFTRLLYGQHPYGIIFPSAAQLEGYGIADLKAFHGQNFGARRARIYVGGRFDQALMLETLEAAFGAWAPGPEVLFDPPVEQAGKRVVLVDRPGAEQSTIYLGLPVINITHPDYVSLQVTNTLLGGYFSSRVTANIREDKGYTYSPRSSLSSRYRTTFWAQLADVTTKDTGAALAEIFFEIDRLQSEELATANELDAVKNFYAGSFILQNATARGVMGQLAAVDRQGVGRDYLASFIARVFATTPQDLQRLARQQLRDQDMALVVVGDLDVIRQQLAALPQLQGVELVEEAPPGGATE
jgi:predicted Zn-dependent peptidase